MKPKLILALFIFLTAANSIFLSFICESAEENTRYPFISGSFYPKDKSELNQMIDGFLAKVPPLEKPEGEIVALIVPHAGYIYSGQTAAYGYKLIEGTDFDTVILLGVYHKAMFDGASIWRSGEWETPLGNVPVDTGIAEAIFKENKLFQFTQDAHLTEHSLEAQVPFLQKVLKDFKIVPILVGTPSVEQSRILAEAILKHTQGKRALIIASTDMSHYYPDSTARKMDALALEFLKKQDTVGLLEEDARKEVELCGIAPTVAALETAKLLGNIQVEVLNYSNSGDVTGDKKNVVGYGSLVIYKSAQSGARLTEEPAGEKLNGERQKKLLKIARETLTAYVKENKTPEFQVNDLVLENNGAVFVTLRKEGDLRGCIGSLAAREPLYLSVRNMTIQSATQDPRFPPVKPEEVDNLKIEISYLTPPKRISGADEIELGRHGVIVRQGRRSGVFLPKVAEETGWSKEEFLGELCSQKAGLPWDCWQDKSTELYVFEAQDFEE